MTHWAVVQTEPQREWLVRLLLMRHGFNTYCPRIKLRSGRIEPLFPTYLFVQLQSQWYAARWTPHVIRLLMAGDRPAQLSENIVTDIHSRERRGFVQLRRLTRGQRVRIVRGSFEGKIAIYHGQVGKDRQRVLLELMGQQVSTVLPGVDIVPLNVAKTEQFR
jgi:transcription antitermination factor NusG